MAVIELKDLSPSGALIGIDPGSKTLGIAASDELRLIASPVEVIRRGKKLAPTLLRLWDIYDQRKATGLIMGLPLNMDGSSGPRVQSARALAKNILSARDIPLAFFDERLSSVQAERSMLEADLSRSRRSELIDASAASLILQTALDRLSNTQS